MATIDTVQRSVSEQGFDLASAGMALLSETPGFESANKVLQSLLALEVATADMYRQTQALVSTGRLTQAEQDKLIAEYDEKRGKLYQIEMRMYMQIVNAAYGATAGSVQWVPLVGTIANLGFSQLVDELPRPNLLPAIVRGPALSSTAGLGVAPFVIGGVVIAPWVAVLIAVAAVAVIVFGMYFAYSLLSDITNETSSVVQRDTTLTKYLQCVESGKTLEQCKPVLATLPQEQKSTSGWVWVLAGAGVLALLGGGAYVYSQYKKTPSRLSGRYDLEV